MLLAVCCFFRGLYLICLQFKQIPLGVPGITVHLQCEASSSDGTKCGFLLQDFFLGQNTFIKKYELREYGLTLARLLSWLECHPIHQKVVGLIPSQGTYRRQLVKVSLSHWCFSLFPFLSL